MAIGELLRELARRTFLATPTGPSAYRLGRSLLLLGPLVGGLVNFAVYSAVVAASARFDLPPAARLLTPYAAVGLGSLSGNLLVRLAHRVTESKAARTAATSPRTIAVTSPASMRS